MVTGWTDVSCHLSCHVSQAQDSRVHTARLFSGDSKSDGNYTEEGVLAIIRSNKIRFPASFPWESGPHFVVSTPFPLPFHSWQLTWDFSPWPVKFSAIVWFSLKLFAGEDAVQHTGWAPLGGCYEDFRWAGECIQQCSIRDLLSCC